MNGSKFRIGNSRRNFHRLGKIAIALIAIIVCVVKTSAATVTYTLDLRVANEFKLFAETSIGDNAGLVVYSVPLLGNVLTIDHRTPVAVGTNFTTAGFNVLRTPAPSADPTGPMTNPHVLGSQDAINAPQQNLIYGIGQQPGTWPPGFVPLSYPDPSSSQISWGYPFLLATGTYDMSTGSLSIDRINVDLVANVWAVQGSRDAPAASVVTQLVPFNPFETMPVAVDHIVSNYNTNEPGDLMHQFIAIDPDVGETFTWDQLTLVSHTLRNGQPGPGPLVEPTLSPSGLFTWISEGSPGQVFSEYVWQVRVRDSAGLEDFGTLTVRMPVPEPGAVALIAIALASALASARRRSPCSLGRWLA